jgi:acetylornithine deacetylase/succinyl-diaminopimelate desuccinylase-like protein
LAAFAANAADAAAAAVIATDPKYNAMLRTTCVATGLTGGHATNALPQLAEANINCRIYPGESAESVRQALERVAADTAVHVLIRSQRPDSPASPLLPEVMGPVERITRELWGNVPVIPTMSTGATDSRFFRARGVPALGVSGLFSDPTVDARAHGRDERMAIRSFFEGQEFLYRLTKALSSSVVAQ